jgi:hypothetical protein
MEQGNNLIVVGDGIFEKKETIRQNGFRWDGINKMRPLHSKNHNLSFTKPLYKPFRTNI